MGEVTAFLARGLRPVLGRPIEERPADNDEGPALSLRQARWVVFLDHVDWHTGEPESASVAHPDQHLGDLRPHLGGVADRARPA